MPNVLKQFVRFMIALCVLLWSQQAHALKVDTHVWVAQAILNDLDKGPTITITIHGKQRSANVPEFVRKAILENRQEFLLGSIGPDAFPGIFEGQMTIHPGFQTKGWGSGDWLAHLLRKAESQSEIAFAYGALIHAAADIFTHTYVNSYSGDIYSLKDGEVDVETRHYLLESYIASKAPPMTDGGRPAAAAHDLIMRDGKLPIPVALLRRAFLDDPDAAQEWGKNGSPHFKAIHDLNRQLKQLSRDNGPLDTLHTLAQKLLIRYYTGLEVNDAELKKLNDAHQRIRDLSNGQIDNLQTFDKDFRDQVGKVLGAGHQVELDALAEAQKLIVAIQAANGDLSKAELDLAKRVKELEDLLDPPCDQICTAAEKPKHCKYLNTPSCDVGNICKQVCNAHANRPGFEDAARLAGLLRQAMLDQLEGSITKYKQANEVAFKTAESIRTVEGKLLHDAIDLAQRFTQHVDPVKGIVLEWLADNDKTMDAYFFANGDAIRLTMLHQSPLPPLKHWVDCNFPSLLGVPSQIAGSNCAVRNLMTEIRDAIDALKRIAVSDVPILREIEQVEAKIEKSLKLAAKAELTNFGTRLTGHDMQSLLDVISKPVTAEMLNEEFARTQGNKKLVLFTDVATRINTEMGIQQNGPDAAAFNPDSYPVIFNAQRLSRLALLDAKGLNKITGLKVFGKSARTQNVIFRFASSIDGNHQWLQHAPPYPRRSPYIPVCGTNYGYSEPFPLWATKSGKSVFGDLFKGPLTPGLEIPKSLGLRSALPSSYPYRPTKRTPYPNWTKEMDKTLCAPPPPS